MPRSRVRFAVLLAASIALAGTSPHRLSAQGTTPPADTVKRADSTTAQPDSLHADDEGGVQARVTAGLTVGALNYPAGRTERATSATLRYRPVAWFSVAATPTFAHTEQPAAIAGRRPVTATGITDLPVEIGAEHAFDIPLSPDLGLGLGITLPLGDSATGLGAGHMGASLSLSGGISPIDHVGLHASLGRSLTDFSIQSSYSSGATGFGDAGVSVEVNDGLSFNVGVDGDVGRVDAQNGRSSSLTAGVNVSTPTMGAISLNASHGVSGMAPSWSVALGIGSDFAAVGTTSARSLRTATSQLRRAFGGGRHARTPRG